MCTPTAQSLLLRRPREGDRYCIVPWIRRHVLSYEGTPVRTVQIHHNQWEQFKKGSKEKSPPSAKNYSLSLISVAHMDGLSSSTSERKTSAFRSWRAPGWGNNSAPLRRGAEKPSSFVGYSYAYLRAWMFFLKDFSFSNFSEIFRIERYFLTVLRTLSTAKRQT